MRGLILYGSVTRGEEGPDSDIDILVLWNGIEQEGWRAMTGIAFDLMVTTGEYVSVKVMNTDTFLGSPGFKENVIQEGITIA
ncbi:MAG: nucleotidyltransferase domain-containing protein [Methanospirillum sp.]|uniref:nucleotidyltransferase family protein n=1 Tax=Methanospirillum sp. TaxID=45200 RepID=UPI0023714FD4|nr:nucleotidyltransferase domain-containing protein [Methanospirillum sp.]MDD1730327.1 nucleotidyltransferase domain-containing protein [Methanospirillum sp.]